MGFSREGLIVTVLVFNVLFPTFAYAFTTLAATSALAPDTVLDPDLLLLAGIDIANATTHTIEWEGGWVEYLMDDGVYRIAWQNHTGYGPYPIPGFALQKRTNWLDRVLSTWIFPETVMFENFDTLDYTGLTVASNETVVSRFEAEYGWSRFPLIKSRLLFLFMANTTISPTFADAILVNGTVIGTFASLVDEELSLNGLISFFAGTLIGDNMYGLPPVFAWVIRLITALSVLALAWFVKDMTQL